MATKISNLTAYTTPLAADVLPIVDTANATTKKISYANLLGGSTWTAFTPTLSGGWNVTGNATFDCKYTQIGKTVFGQIVIVNGNTTTYQAGNLTFTLPVTSTSSDVAFIGPAYIQDTGVASYTGFFQRFSATTAGIICQAIDPTAVVDVYTRTAVATNLIPFTWGDTDVIRGTFMYEAA